MNMLSQIATTRPEPVQPRAVGHLRLSAKHRDGQSVIDGLRQSGCLKALFPRRHGMLEAILINTAGGVTGGDRLSFEAEAGAGSHLSLTTQAAERAYRSRAGQGHVETHLSVGDGATLFWLPQETILFEGCAFRRRLRADLADDARLLLVEPVIFGRAAMGEDMRDAVFDDRIEIWEKGGPIYMDATRLSGDIAARLDRPALAGGARAMVCLVWRAPEAEAHLAAVRDLLPETGAASLLRPDLMVLRCLAPDGFLLRRALLPVLDLLTRHSLPLSWRL